MPFENFKEIKPPDMPEQHVVIGLDQASRKPPLPKPEPWLYRLAVEKALSVVPALHKASFAFPFPILAKPAAMAWLAVSSKGVRVAESQPAQVTSETPGMLQIYVLAPECASKMAPHYQIGNDLEVILDGPGDPPENLFLFAIDSLL